MSSILKFRIHYFAIASNVFIIEILIALFAHDKIIRPYVGDFLVVILIYCFLKSFIDISVQKAAILVLLFSYFIEILQYFKIINKLGLQESRLARTIIGTSFAWVDLVAYTLGIITVIYLEKLRAGRPTLSRE